MEVSTVIARILERLEGYYEEFFIEDECQGVTVVYKNKEYRIFEKDLAIYEFLIQRFYLEVLGKENKDDKKDIHKDR